MESRGAFRVLVAVAFGCALGLAPAMGAVPAYLVVKVGDTVGPSTVSTVNTPFTDGNGKVGFVGSLADNQRFIWWNTGPVFFSSSALPLVLTGGESTMGVSNTGGFIYSPSVDTNDAVYTHGGVLLMKTDPIPCLPGLYSTFNSRPTMLPDGTALWFTGSAATPTGSTTNRHLLRASDPTNPASIVRVLGGGDVIEGKPIKTSASNFDYWFSNNGLHHIHVLDMDTGSSTNNEHIYLDGRFVAQESLPTGGGDNWSTFDVVGVNNAGNYIFTGDTDGPTATDEFVAYNSVIGVREGDTLDGITLASGAALRAASINDLDQVVHMWGWGSGSTLQEHLFFGEGANLAGSIRLLSTGDVVDVNGDGIAEYRITDFNASTVTGPGLDLAEDGWVYLDVDMVLVAGGTEVEAIIGVLVPEPGALGMLALLGLGLIRGRR